MRTTLCIIVLLMRKVLLAVVCCQLPEIQYRLNALSDGISKSKSMFKKTRLKIVYRYEVLVYPIIYNKEAI